MGSTRLPGKVLKPLMGAPMLQRQLERLARCRFVDRTVVATTTLPSDDPIVDLVDNLDLDGIGSFRGPENDVLARYFEAAREENAEVVVRVTADCPLIDPGVVDAAIDLYLKNRGSTAYVTNSIVRTYPRGLDVEVFPMSVLETAAREAVSGSDREHVTPFVWRQPERFLRLDLVDSEDNSELRWTVDTPEDYELVKRLYEQLYPTDPAFDYRAALKVVRAQPELRTLNQHVQQKKV